jgi:predicted HicB family RNase H-like nuclease
MTNAKVNLILRFDKRLRRQIVTAAKRARRSMDSEIVVRLQEWFKRRAAAKADRSGLAA